MALGLYQSPVSVPIHDYVFSVGAEKLIRFRRSDFMPMTYVNGNTAKRYRDEILKR